MRNHVFIFFFPRSLSRSSSGASSVESFTSPLKVVEKDISTGEYLVRMSPQDYDRISTQAQTDLNTR